MKRDCDGGGGWLQGFGGDTEGIGGLADWFSLGDIAGAAVSFGRGGGELAVACGDGCVRTVPLEEFGLTPDNLSSLLRHSSSSSFQQEGKALGASQNGNRLTSSDGRLRGTVGDEGGGLGKGRRAFAVCTSPLHSISFVAPEIVACGAFDGALSCYSLRGGALKSRDNSHGDSVSLVKYAADGCGLKNALASGSSDQSLRLWTVGDGRLQAVRILDLHEADPSCLEICGPALVSGDVDGLCTVWDPRATDPVAWAASHAAPLLHASLAGPRVLTVTAAGSVNLWDLRRGPARGGAAGEVRSRRTPLVHADAAVPCGDICCAISDGYSQVLVAGVKSGAPISSATGGDGAEAAGRGAVSAPCLSLFNAEQQTLVRTWSLPFAPLSLEPAQIFGSAAGESGGSDHAGAGGQSLWMRREIPPLVVCAGDAAQVALLHLVSEDDDN